METKINDVKEFAIGTKIEYDGKLYEVVAQTYCDNCSIANICSNSNIYDKTGYVLSVDKRLSIFGECSSLDRYDTKSVVFVEVLNSTSKDEYYKIIPLWIDDNSTELKPVEFDLPKDYVIDKEHSDLDKGIIRFKNKWSTLEQLYKSAKDNNYHTYLSEIKDSTDDKSCTVKDKLIALANLMDIASYFSRGWNYDFTKECVGYSIVYCKSVKESHYSIRETDNYFHTYYGNPVFKNEADAQYVIDNPNFRNILDKIFKG